MAAIHHVTLELESSALEPCIAFYGHLGFEPVEVPPGIAGRAIWLEDRSRGQQVHLMPTQAPLARAGHFAVVCPDYEATVRGWPTPGTRSNRGVSTGAPRAPTFAIRPAT